MEKVEIKTCPICMGDGYIGEDSFWFDYVTVETCPDCNGDGFIDEDD